MTCREIDSAVIVGPVVNTAGAPVVYLRPGESPPRSAYTLVICDPQMPAEQRVRRSDGITLFVRSNALAGRLAAIAEQAAADGHHAVYVVEPQGALAELPDIVPESWLGKWAD